MNRRSILRPLLITVFTVMLFCSCDMFSQEGPPFEYGSVTLVSSAGQCHGWAGLHCEIRNQSETAVRRICLSLRMSDTDGFLWPSAGDNPFTYVVEAGIPPGEPALFCLDLARTSYYRPVERLIIYDLGIDWIEYQGGDKWEDRYRSYTYPYEIEYVPD